MTSLSLLADRTVGTSCSSQYFLTMQACFIDIRRNKILAKIYEFTEDERWVPY